MSKISLAGKTDHPMLDSLTSDGEMVQVLVSVIEVAALPSGVRVTCVGREAGADSVRFDVPIEHLLCPRCSDCAAWCPDFIARWPVAANGRG